MLEAEAIHDRRDSVGTLPDAVDFEVHRAGFHVRMVPRSTRALAWFWACPEREWWPYFHYYRYGDTAYGRYTAVDDDGFASLVAALRSEGFVIEP